MSVVQFVGNYLGRSPNISGLRAVNMFPVLINNGQGIALFGTPGINLEFNFGSSPVRGWRVFENTLYAVCRSSFYKVDLAGNITLINSLIVTTDGFVDMTDNGIELFFVDGVNRYVYNFGTAAFAQAADTSDTCAFLDGFFIKSDNTTGDFFISAAYDGLTWDPLDTARAESRADNIVRVFTNFSSLMLFGTTTVEIWYNDSGPVFPFSRMQGGTMNIGLLATESLVQTGDNGESLIWLARTAPGKGCVVRSDGGAPTNVTTKEVEYLWAKYAVINDAIAYTYREEGITFYVITFPSAGKTWALDVNNGVWHERSSGMAGSRHISNRYVFFNNKNLVSSYIDGQVGSLDMDAYTDNGDTILRKVVTPHVGTDERKTTVCQLQVDMEEGVGLPSGQGSDPTIMMRKSHDRGHTWGNEFRSSFGKIGEYGFRALFRRLGTKFYHTYELTISDPVKVVIINLLVKTQ